jgi:hypothetical protein
MNLNDAFPSKYLKTEDLKGRDVSVVIEAIDQVTLPQGQGRKLVATFRGKAKAWIVNKTNANTIAKVLGTDETDDWVGQEIVLYPTETEFQGDMVDAIRVRRKKASSAPQAPTAPIAESEPAYLDEDDSAPF